jgi:hypothetical protein
VQLNQIDAVGLEVFSNCGHRLFQHGDVPVGFIKAMRVAALGEQKELITAMGNRLPDEFFAVVKTFGGDR